MFSVRTCQLFNRKVLPITFPLGTISFKSTTFSANFYEDLGISKTSTQGEIKTAYYRLSMLYHPDKNKGSESAALKFRQITQAYEVLGNFRLRRLYDKGIVHTAGSQYAHKAEETVDDEEAADDPSTKFYKSRFTKSKVTDNEGRTPIYNFDEWSRCHYGTSFNRKKNAKEKYNRTKAQEEEHVFATQKEILLFGITFGCILIYLNFMAESSYDTPKEKQKKNS